MLGLDLRKRSRVFALSPARSGTHVGSEITCVKQMKLHLLCLLHDQERVSALKLPLSSH